MTSSQGASIEKNASPKVEMDCKKLDKKKYSSTLAAAALQDHISRQISLGDPTTKRRRPARPPVQTRGKTCVKCGNQGSTDKEYTLDVAPPSFTLAQTLGLVPAPRQLLTSEEWESVKACSNKREDSQLPCPICQEEFGLNEQVLLSCSHVFHLSCLRAFERFSRTKRCPLCRCEGYQTRVILDGAKLTRKRAAIRIQAVWRGYRVRSWYRAYREEHPPSHPSLRRRYFQDKLSRLTRELIISCDVRAEGVASVLSQSDQALENARSVMRAFDLCTGSSVDIWTEARKKAKAHLSNDCAVCLTPLTPSQLHTLTLSQPHTLTPSRPLSLLSCGHLLHTSCITSLEQYSDSSVFQCPLCRAQYHRTAYSSD